MAPLVCWSTALASTGEACGLANSPTVDSTYDGASGTAGGAAFGGALAAAARDAGLDAAALAHQAGLDEALVRALLAGEARVAVPALARLARALKLRAIEFMQTTGLLSLEVYAMGLDPLYFLPEGPIRFDARIYMREINPRHAVPEGDMLKRNPVLAALRDDLVLDSLGRLEVELAYLLRAAVQKTNGVL
jgi:transcriptional regulator with XRE-family HTH domain